MCTSLHAQERDVNVGDALRKSDRHPVSELTAELSIGGGILALPTFCQVDTSSMSPGENVQRPPWSSVFHAIVWHVFSRRVAQRHMTDVFVLCACGFAFGSSLTLSLSLTLSTHALDDRRGGRIVLPCSKDCIC